jgi:paraquat-inducible protein B
MKTKLNPALVGMFVLGAFGLIVVALLSFRSVHLFSKPVRFVAYFNESVQGLDLGSAVKLRGVRVGRVVAIRVRYDGKTWPAPVAVVGELDNNAITDSAGQTIKLTDRATLQRLVEEGLRAKLDLVGITGLQFVQLDFLDPRIFPAPPANRAVEYPVVPTVASEIAELMASLSKIVNDLKKADFAEVSRELKSLLITANQKTGELDLKKMVTQVTAAAESIAALAGSAEARAAFTNLNKTATDVQALVARLDTQVEPVRIELVRTLRSFHDAAESVRKLLGPQSGLGEEAARMLQQVTETAESLQRLADFLERNPNALITGKKRPGKEP